MLTAYTVRMAQLLDPHCDMLLVGDSWPGDLRPAVDGAGDAGDDGAHGAAVVRGSYHAVVIVDMPFGSYEGSARTGVRQCGARCSRRPAPRR